jgi:hypothetical protein
MEVFALIRNASIEIAPEHVCVYSSLVAKVERERGNIDATG